MKSFIIVLSIYAAMSGFSSAQTMDHSKMKHGSGSAMEMATGLPTEPGQSAFEPLLDCRRLIYLSYAAMGILSMAS